MIYLIFTEQGFDEAKADILQSKAALWINPDILSEQQQAELAANDINYSTLPEFSQADNEREVIKALQWVEKQSQDKHILVEYI